MRIGFDSHALRPPLTGIGVYSWNVINTLREIGDTSEYTFFSYYLRGKAVSVPDHPRNVVLPLKKVPWVTLQKFWMASGFPAADRWFGDFDIVHGLFNFAPPTRLAKRVVTIYDVAFLKFPERFKPSHARHFAAATRYSCRVADAVVTISEHTKRDLVEHFAVPPEKIVVAYPAFKRELFRPLEDRCAVEAARLRLGIGKGRVILYLGTLEPRKNLDVLIDAFERIDRKHAGEFQLVLAGRQGSDMDALMARIRPLQEQGKISRLGYVTEKDTALLYNLAEVFAYPSLYEGFGIPPLEAMACGCPVVTSNVSSLPEAVGDSGLLVDPRSADDLTTSLLRILESPSLRKELSEKGLAQARTFSWENAAQKTLELYQSLCGMPAGKGLVREVKA